MRILHIITRLILGGAQQNTILCCRAQAQAGHDVHLLYGPIYGPEGSLLPQAQASGATLHEESSMRRAVLPIHDYICYHRLRRLIRQLQPDVVHTHSSKAGIVGRAAAWREKTPAIVHTIHGLPFHPRNPAIVNQLYTHLERRAAKQCHTIVGVTQAMCTDFQQRRIGQPHQFTVVPSGMDIEEFTCADNPALRAQIRRELNIPPTAPVIGIVARLDKLKGQEDLLSVTPQLLQKHPDLHILLVGDGWYRQTLQTQAANLHIQHRVIFTGLVQPPRVPQLLSVMDIHALPSYQEGQPRTMVQALLTRCAIVGYDAGGIRDVCQHQHTGLLVPLADRAALHHALDQLLSNPDYRLRLASQGQAFAKQTYDYHIMVNRLETIYTQLLQNTSRSSPHS